MDSLPIEPSEDCLCLDGDPPVEALPILTDQHEPVISEPDTTRNPIIPEIPASESQSNDPLIQSEFRDTELMQDMKDYMEKIDKQSEIAQPSNITIDEVANLLSVRMTRPQSLSEELLSVIDQVFGTIISHDKSLKRLVEEPGELTDTEPPSPAKMSSCKMSCVEIEQPQVCEVGGPMVPKFENEELLADDVEEAAESKFENEESVVTELVEELIEFESEETGIMEMSEPTESFTDLEEAGEVIEEPIMTEQSEHEESAVSQLHSNPVLRDTLIGSPTPSDMDIIREAKGKTEWKDLKGIIKDIEESSADGENSNITVDKIASIISTKYVEFLEEEWQRRRNVWLRGVKHSSKRDDYQNFNSAYAFATFGEYVASHQAQLQVPFDLPEIEIGGDTNNPEL